MTMLLPASRGTAIRAGRASRALRVLSCAAFVLVLWACSTGNSLALPAPCNGIYAAGDLTIPCEVDAGGD
jgi:hypothetical protein